MLVLPLTVSLLVSGGSRSILHALGCPFQGEDLVRLSSRQKEAPDVGAAIDCQSVSVCGSTLTPALFGCLQASRT